MALLRGSEQAAHGEQSFASLRLKCDGDVEAHVLVVILAGTNDSQLEPDSRALIAANVTAPLDIQVFVTPT